MVAIAQENAKNYYFQFFKVIVCSHLNPNPGTFLKVTKRGNPGVLGPGPDVMQLL